MRLKWLIRCNLIVSGVIMFRCHLNPRGFKWHRNIMTLMRVKLHLTSDSGIMKTLNYEKWHLGVYELLMIASKDSQMCHFTLTPCWVLWHDTRNGSPNFGDQMTLRHVILNQINLHLKTVHVYCFGGSDYAMSVSLFSNRGPWFPGGVFFFLRVYTWHFYRKSGLENLSYRPSILSTMIFLGLGVTALDSSNTLLKGIGIMVV